MQQHLASIEAKYGDDLEAAKALLTRPPAIHDEPEMVITTASPAEKKKVTIDKEAVVFRSGPITLTPTGDVHGVLVACPSGGPANPSSSASSGSGGPSGGSLPGGVPPSAGKQDGRQQPYDIEKDKGTQVPFPSIDEFGIKLFTSMGEEHLLASYLDCNGPCEKHITVQYVEASDPLIWIARAAADVPPDTVMLVPWTSPLVRIVTDTTTDSGGALLQSVTTRPKHLFAGLPLVAMMQVACPDLDESLLLAARSPLSGKHSCKIAPPAFWCALEAGEKDEGRANMEMRFAKMEFKSASMQVDERPRKRRRDPKVQVTFPILVNVKPLNEGDALVFPRGTKFQITDGAADQDGSPSVQKASAVLKVDLPPFHVTPPPPLCCPFVSAYPHYLHAHVFNFSTSGRVNRFGTSFLSLRRRAMPMPRGEWVA